MASAPRSALVVVAHPDDCEYGAGGTVAAWARAGAEVHLLVLTDGSRGSHDVDVADSDLVAARREEQRCAAELLGLAGVDFLDRRDGELEPDGALVAEIAKRIRRLRPEVLVTHDPWLLYPIHPDHTAAGIACWKAALRAREPRFYPELATAGLPAWRPRELWLFAPERATHVEDVSETFDSKLDALLCHRSQYATSFAIHAADGDDERRFRKLMSEDAAAVGAPIDAPLGEAFHVLEL